MSYDPSRKYPIEEEQAYLDLQDTRVDSNDEYDPDDYYYYKDEHGEPFYYHRDDVERYAGEDRPREPPRTQRTTKPPVRDRLGGGAKEFWETSE